MSTQPALRPQAAAPDAALLQSDRRFRLHPDVVAEVAGTNAAPAGILTRVIDMLAEWHIRARGRRELASCDQRMLRDMGISPYDAGLEAGKPFWRV
jgi:uncharacterized protein YjiS (DUF1127 family)